MGEDPRVSRMLEIHTLDLSAWDCGVCADAYLQLVLIRQTFDCEHTTGQVELECRSIEFGEGC